MVVDGLGEAQQGGQDGGDGCHVRFLQGDRAGAGAPRPRWDVTQAAATVAVCMVASSRSVLRSGQSYDDRSRGRS